MPRGGLGARAVLLARGGLQLGEALEAERLREPHDGRGRGVGAPRELLRGVEGHLVEMVDDVLRDVLLRARELVEARRDVGRQVLVALCGGRHRGGPRHGEESFTARGAIPSPGQPEPVATQRLDTRLPGLVLLAAAVHGDARGFSWRPTAPRLGGGGRAAAFLQDNHSRSRRARCAGCTSRASRPGQARPRGARARARRPRRPAPRLPDLRRGRGSSSTTITATSLHPRRLGHGFCVLSETADFAKCTNYYDAATEPASADDPASASRGPPTSSSSTRPRPRRPAARRSRRHPAVQLRR